MFNKLSENEKCYICNDDFKIGNIIQRYSFEKDCQELIHLFLNKKLNNDIALNIIKILKKPSYIHCKCLSKKTIKIQKNYIPAWCVSQNNIIYLINQYKLYH